MGKLTLPGTEVWVQGLLLGAVVAACPVLGGLMRCGWACRNTDSLSAVMLWGIALGGVAGVGWFLWQARSLVTWNRVPLNQLGLHLMGVVARLVGAVSLLCLIVTLVLTLAYVVPAVRPQETGLWWLLLGALGTCQLVRPLSTAD